MQTYITDRSEVSIVFQYPDPTEDIFNHIKNAFTIILVPGKSELENVKDLAGYVHNLFSHNGYNIPSSLNPMVILSEARKGKSFRCVEYSYLTMSLLWSYNIPARIIGLKTKDCAERLENGGHVVLEFWSQEFQQWVMCDVQAGVIPMFNDKPLSSFEMFEIMASHNVINFISIDHSRFNSNDEKKYVDWIYQYLYFFDTPIITSVSDIYTEKNRLEEQRLMLVPIESEPPKVFQRTIFINAVYTHSVVDFYRPISNSRKPSYK